MPASVDLSTLPPLSTEAVTPDYFVRHYKEIIVMYIANGRPSPDTLRSRYSNIDQFIAWCIEKQIHPLAFREYHMRIYVTYLNGRGYKKDSVALKIVSLRSFFNAAQKMGLIDENPCRDIHMGWETRNDMSVLFYTPEQLYKIIDVWHDEPNDFLRWRNTAVVYLMAVEGLRNIEVCRMNREDIDWDVGSIYIHGKGHDRQIFPCYDTFDALKQYLAAAPAPNVDAAGTTPMFLSFSNAHQNGRLSRNGLRFIMNKALSAAGMKKAPNEALDP